MRPLDLQQHCPRTNLKRLKLSGHHVKLRAKKPLKLATRRYGSKGTVSKIVRGKLNIKQYNLFIKIFKVPLTISLYTVDRSTLKAGLGL